ncbi:MAG: hypothetical protein SOU51_03555 [Collinsella sp.]|nr:hypothetical protein [Collinsella sp.]
MQDDQRELESGEGEVPTEAREQDKTTAEILRERRVAAQGGPHIDHDIHFSLPLTRVFIAIVAVAAISYLLSIVGGRMGVEALFYGGRWACSLLFIVAVPVWFASRHQAKVLTDEKYADQRAMARAAADRRAEKRRAKKKRAKSHR